jgi:hypothetical protein
MSAKTALTSTTEHRDRSTPTGDPKETPPARGPSPPRHKAPAEEPDSETDEPRRDPPRDKPEPGAPPPMIQDPAPPDANPIDPRVFAIAFPI